MRFRAEFGQLQTFKIVENVDPKTLIEMQTAVVEVANALLEGRMPFLEGIRKLSSMRVELSRLDHDPDFLLFVGIDSESDHLPSVTMRAVCSQAWLDKCDRDVAELEAFYMPAVRASCLVLVRRFGPSDGVWS